jgi:hypothetical protein
MVILHGFAERFSTRRIMHAMLVTASALMYLHPPP